jgi:geranylgeranyl diphosphate synthase type II
VTTNLNTPQSALLAGEYFFTGYCFTDDETLVLDQQSEQCEHHLRALLGLPHHTPSPIQELMAHHLDSGGRRVRARLALSAAMRLQLPMSTAMALATCCELIHNASLLHDDIQDGDSERRQATAAWKQFTPELAMCGGVMMLSAAYRALSELGAAMAPLAAHVHERTADLIHGQAMDLSQRTAAFDVNSYSSMAAGKSGSLLALPLELAMLAAGHHGAVAKARAAGEAFAIAYQVADDLGDFRSDRTQDIMNMISALIRNGCSEQAAIQQARALIDAQAERACSIAQQLPHGSGGLLIELAGQLRGNDPGSGLSAL